MGTAKWPAKKRKAGRERGRVRSPPPSSGDGATAAGPEATRRSAGRRGRGARSLPTIRGRHAAPGCGRRDRRRHAVCRERDALPAPSRDGILALRRAAAAFSSAPPPPPYPPPPSVAMLMLEARRGQLRGWLQGRSRRRRLQRRLG